MPEASLLQSAFGGDDHALAAELFDSIRELSKAGHGVTRPAYSETETAVLQVIAETGARFGLQSRVDGAANLVVSLPDAPAGVPFWVGSHVDSVAEGGNFDGLAGVIAGLLCLIKAQQQGVKLQRPIELVALRAEEAVWFGKTYLGSSALLGLLDESDMTRQHRETKRPLREYFAGVGAEGEKIAGGVPLVDLNRIGAWLELHIEQGPAMVGQGVPVGVVTGIRGSTRHKTVHCHGTAGHSGAVPRVMRHDAVLAMAQLMSRLDDHWKRLEDEGADLVLTFGIVATNPEEHAETRIPGDVSFSLDIRSKSAETVEAFYQLFREECRTIEESRGVMFEYDNRVIVEPASVDATWAQRFRDSASALGYPYIDILSGAGHDAGVFSNVGVPSAMVFVRNDGGSHNPLEQMDIDDFMKGVAVLYHALISAAQEP